jgi:hypothetical protein
LTLILILLSILTLTGKGKTSEAAEKLTNACSAVEERRFSAA